MLLRGESRSAMVLASGARLGRWVSHKARGRDRGDVGGNDRAVRCRVPRAAGAGGWPPGPSSGRCDGHLVLVELQQVVGGGDQAPFRACGGSASSQKLIDAPVVLGLCE